MWIYDIRAEELINLKDCTSVWKHQKRVSTETVNYSLNLILNKKLTTYIMNPKSKEIVHFRIMLYCLKLKN